LGYHYLYTDIVGGHQFINFVIDQIMEDMLSIPLCEISICHVHHEILALAFGDIRAILNA